MEWISFKNKILLLELPVDKQSSGNCCEDCVVYDKCHGIMQYGTKCFRPKESDNNENLKNR